MKGEQLRLAMFSWMKMSQISFNFLFFFFLFAKNLTNFYFNSNIDFQRFSISTDTDIFCDLKFHFIDLWITTKTNKTWASLHCSPSTNVKFTGHNHTWTDLIYSILLLEIFVRINKLDIFHRRKEGRKDLVLLFRAVAVC